MERGPLGRRRRILEGGKKPKREQVQKINKNKFLRTLNSLLSDRIHQLEVIPRGSLLRRFISEFR
jgi:hypothetical protein